MPLDHFVIYLDNPSASYFPGQVVSGRVVIRSSSEKKTQGIKLKFEGKASVHWTEEVTETRGTGDDRREQRVTKSYSDSESYFEFKSYLLGDGRSDAYIQPGETSCPFSFQLPVMNIPSSYVGNHGKVEYFLEATVKRSWKFDYHAKQFITVNSIVDLNNDPQASQPGNWAVSKTFCCWCCASAPLSVNIRTNTVGYCPGEKIALEIEVNNLSNREVTDLSAKLTQEARFFAQGKQKNVQSQLFSIKRGQTVQAGDSDIWRAEIQIPPVPPTKLGGCRIIDVEYILQVTVHVSGMAFNLNQSCQIIVGTLPLRARFDVLRSADTVPSAPPFFAPNGYADLPPPRYQDSYNFRGDPPSAPPGNVVDNITNTVIDNIAPSDPDHVPKYVTYGWNLSQYPVHLKQ